MYENRFEASLIAKSLYSPLQAVSQGQIDLAPMCSFNQHTIEGATSFLGCAPCETFFGSVDPQASSCMHCSEILALETDYSSFVAYQVCQDDLTQLEKKEEVITVPIDHTTHEHESDVKEEVPIIIVEEESNSSFVEIL